MIVTRWLVLLISFICSPLCVHFDAQDLPPGEMLTRTFAIQATEQGTCFSIDYKGKYYLVTARHIVSELPVSNATVKIRLRGEWKELKVVRVILPESKDVDVAALLPDQSIPKPSYSVSLSDDHDLYMGQQLWFLGYPFLEGMGSHFPNGVEAPFIKRGTLSAIDSRTPENHILYIDGFNNEGFSGGPIVFWDLDKHVYKIAGVVDAYREQPAKTLINGQQVDTTLLVNSGILVAADIRSVTQAIDHDLSVSQ